MTDFTYEVPNEEDYFHTLIQWLKKKGEEELLDLLDGAKCTIYTTSSFSYRRWDEMRAKIQFYVPVERLDPSEKVSEKLIKICNMLMPSDAGFNVMDVEFLPMITSAKINESPKQDLEKATQNLSKEIMKEILPDEVKNKGVEMSRTYLYLYCVENVLRLFIHNVSKKKLGDDYFDKLQINNDIKKRIEIRKKDEKKNKWIGMRGDSDIFYVDFDDLGSIIQNNWETFSTYFPSQQWILAKIEDLTKCRNLVAHNSIIGDNEKKLVGVYFESIMRQLGDTVESINE